MSINDLKLTAGYCINWLVILNCKISILLKEDPVINKDDLIKVAIKQIPLINPHLCIEKCKLLLQHPEILWQQMYVWHTLRKKCLAREEKQ